jgi:BirA family biotin operon repressor/biotin-[acetyl-CoA-carboxylase] ligase
MVTSLAIRNALTQFVSDITIKWPNDIYYRDQKITGILIENSLLGSTISASIIGVGQNVNQTEFPEWIPNPISLKQILNKEVDRNSVLNAILVQTENMYNRLQNGDFENIRKDYLQSLYHRDGYYKYESKGEVFEARIITVEDNGELVLLDKNGDERRFMFKEVSFVIEA